MGSNLRVYIAGHRGMVGGAIVRCLQKESEIEVITRTHEELDLTDQKSVREFFASERIDQIYLAAAKVGGINANDRYPAEFIYENLMIESNVIHEAWRAGIQNILFMGSSCIYPKLAPQPMSEDALLTGLLEPTNEPYAIAKIAGIKLCESYNRQYGTDYRAVMPTNVYGPGDTYDLERSHVIPALIKKFHEAKEKNSEKVEIWGSGNPRREFIFVDDLAEASISVMNCPESKFRIAMGNRKCHVNVGFGEDITINELAMIIAEIVGFDGKIENNLAMPDGTPRKLLDSSALNLIGYKPQISLRTGLKVAYKDFVARSA